MKLNVNKQKVKHQIALDIIRLIEIETGKIEGWKDMIKLLPDFNKSWKEHKIVICIKARERLIERYNKLLKQINNESIN